MFLFRILRRAGEKGDVIVTDDDVLCPRGNRDGRICVTERTVSLEFVPLSLFSPSLLLFFLEDLRHVGQNENEPMEIVGVHQLVAARNKHVNGNLHTRWIVLEEE